MTHRSRTPPSPTTSDEPAAALAARHNARWYFSGLAASLVGNSAMSLVAGIWVKSLTGSSAKAGLVSACEYAPTMVAPLAGLLADRVSRSRLLFWLNLTSAVTILPLVLVRSASQVWIVFAVMVVYGIEATLNDPAEDALFAQMFTPEFRRRINGWRLTIQETGRLASPLLGASLFLLLGGGTVAALDAATFVLATIVITRLRVRVPPARPEPERLRRALSAGTRHVWNTASIRSVALAATAIMALSGVGVAAQYSLVHGIGQRPAFLGVLSAALGAGSIIASLSAGPIIHRLGERRLAVIGLLNFAAGSLLRANHLLPAALLGSFVLGFALPYVFLATLNIAQGATPDELQGRVSAALLLALFGPQAATQALGSLLISHATYSEIYIVSAAGSIAIALWLCRGSRVLHRDASGYRDEVTLDEQTRPTASDAGGRQNVLELLDDQLPSAFIWRLTILSCLGGLLFGLDTSNIGSALNFVPYHLDGFWSGYLVAGASLGAAAGAVIAGPLTDRLGRKSLLVFDAGLYAVGSILSAASPDAAVLLIARTMIGLAIGADTAVATAYIAEYAPRSRRGSLSMLQQWMITVGIFVAYAVAVVILRADPSGAGTVGWRVILGFGAIPALIGLVLRAKMPESPRWLMRHGKYEAMHDALKEFGIDATLEDVRYTADQLEQAAAKQERRAKNAWTPGVKRAVVVVSIFFVFQQITGINVPLYYGPKLLGPIFEGSNKSLVWTTIAGVEITGLMTIFNVGFTYFGFRYIDRIGRRKMSIGGFGGMIVFALIAAAGLGLLTGTPKTVLTTVGLCGFISSFAVGVGGIGWTIQGETFPTEVRGQAASIGATFDWIANFALIEVFPTWESGIGLDWVLVCFAALCVMAIAFVYRYLPETKGLSVEQITARYEEIQRTGSPASHVSG